MWLFGIRGVHSEYNSYSDVPFSQAPRERAKTLPGEMLTNKAGYTSNEESLAGGQGQ